MENGSNPGPFVFYSLALNYSNNISLSGREINASAGAMHNSCRSYQTDRRLIGLIGCFLIEHLPFLRSLSLLLLLTSSCDVTSVLSKKSISYMLTIELLNYSGYHSNVVSGIYVLVKLLLPNSSRLIVEKGFHNLGLSFLSAISHLF